jgi:hypothetical protein
LPHSDAPIESSIGYLSDLVAMHHIALQTLDAIYVTKYALAKSVSFIGK